MSVYVRCRPGSQEYVTENAASSFTDLAGGFVGNGDLYAVRRAEILPRTEKREMTGQATIFDAIAAREASDKGIALAADGNGMLAIGRTIAHELARRHGRVTADDVIKEMVNRGYKGDELGNAAGSLFKRGFRFTGEYVASERVASHGRMIRVWRLR